MTRYHDHMKNTLEQARKEIAPLRLNIPRACAALDFSRAKVYQLMKSGELRAHHDGRRTFFLPSEIERYVQMRATS
jgi:predicted DNA-binding transcriptional regulator AlpA